MEEIIGNEFGRLDKSITKLRSFRHKIIHGQLTGENLDRKRLEIACNDIRQWCEILASEGHTRFGYDGFGRSSLKKTGRHDVTASVDRAIGREGWESFVKQLSVRKTKKS